MPGRCSALYVVCCSSFRSAPILAIVFGHLGLLKALKGEEVSGGMIESKGLAITGQMLGYILLFSYITLTVIGLVGSEIWLIFSA